jgi:hypothetical protein
MVMDDGRTVFTVVAARDDEDRLMLTFDGVLRVHNPNRYLWSFLEDLGRILPGSAFASIRMDFTRMPFINDNSFYTIMDIVDAAYLHVPGPVTVRRIANDEWQRVTLPILLNLSEEDIAARTTFEDVEPPAR